MKTETGLLARRGTGRGAIEKSTGGPGAALRALRTQRGWTLAEVAERTGLPISTLSKLENSKMSLTYAKLVALSAGLNVDIAQLVSADFSTPPSSGRASGRRSVTRARQGQTIDTGHYFYQYLAADLLNKHFVPIVGEIRARSIEEFGDLIPHSGEEFVYVLEGAVEIHTSQYAPLKLEVGDSMYFDSEMPHAYIAAAPGPCRILSVCSASETHLLEMIRDPGKYPRADAPAAAKRSGPEARTATEPKPPRASRKR